MKTERFIQNWPAPDGLLAKASLEQLIPRAKIGHFPRDSIVCTDDQLAGCAYVVLKGKCELRRKFRGYAGNEVQSYNAGDTFGGPADLLPTLLASEVVAVQDSVVLAVQMEDLAEITGQPLNGRNGAAHKISGANTRFFFNNNSKNQSISLVFISDSLPVEAISQKLAAQLLQETGEPVILVEFATSRAGHSDGVAEFDHEVDGSGTLPGGLHRDETGLHRLRLKLPGQLPEPEVIGELFRKLRRRFHFVLASVTASRIPRSYLLSCVTQSDAACFLMRPEAKDLFELDWLLHELRPRLNTPSAIALRPILCLGKDEKFGDFDNRIIGMGIPSPELIRDCPGVAATGGPPPGDVGSGLFQTDIRRIARVIGKCLVGLALSSGGAKGLSHIGVIQVFEESGLDVDVVAGASMGAYVGAVWAYGHAGDKLEALAREMEMKRAMWTLLDPVIPPWRGFMRGYAVKRRLQKSIGAAQFSDLARSLRVVAAHLDTMERVVFSTGDVATAVHASVAVPGICVPVRIGGDLYVDGGIVDPLPTDVLHEMGVSKIIAVNTIPTPEHIRYCMQIEHEWTRLPPTASHSFVRKFLPHRRHVNHYAHSNILDILMHSTHGAQMRVAEANSHRANIVLRPDMCDDRWLDFRNPGFYIRAGREVALRHLDEIKALIKQKGASYEHQPPPKALAEVVPA